MKILIKDLSEGINEFREEIPVGDIELPDSDFYTHPIVLNLYIDRLDNIFRMKVNINTQAKNSCDRCLEEFDSEFSASAEQMYQLGSGKLDDEEEVEILPADTREINIDKVIQDVFVMSKPIQLLCSESCKGLCAICGINLNEKQCKCNTDHIDPRLEKLKSLLN